MEILSRFRKKKAPEEASEPVGEALKNWRTLSEEVAQLNKLEYTLDLKTTIRLDDGSEIVFLPGTKLQIVPEHDDEPKSIGEKPLHWSTQVRISRPEPTRDINGKAVESSQLLYYAEPDSQQIYDYTDPEHPKGKIITNTDNSAYRSVYSLVHFCLVGETPRLPE